MLVTAKAPVPGFAKTRLAASVGPERAAELACAALLDTLAACAEAVGPARCRLALAGDLGAATGREQLVSALRGWQVVHQGGGTLGERLAAAHRGIEGPVVQIGMDTPQVSAALLREVAAGLADHDGVLGEATDGGWWVLALRDGRRAAPLADVPMSTPTTAADTRAALEAAGLWIGRTQILTDVDRAADADLVAREAPGTRFAALWNRVPA